MGNFEYHHWGCNSNLSAIVLYLWNPGLYMGMRKTFLTRKAKTFLLQKTRNFVVYGIHSYIIIEPIELRYSR